MNLLELIAKVGEDKVAVQELQPAVTNITARRGHSTVTFRTVHMTPADLLVPGGEVGLILWIKCEDLPPELR